ncbi:DUF2934 domain-containing protein [Xanthobacter sp. V4C-4]|uniref:DUF2934 domain-containing protein n=1 Tax=Xanthobacter cornucopiae TaxID=3119924 RepID=UPI00372B5097
MNDAVETQGPQAGPPPPVAADGLSFHERDQIRRRARAIWREEGCPDGKDREHWARAELEVLKSGVRR